MDESTSRAVDYRRQAALCLEIAGCISSLADRDRVIAMAQHWLDLAEQAGAGKA
jgi:hypothetical protein